MIASGPRCKRSCQVLLKSRPCHLLLIAYQRIFLNNSKSLKHACKLAMTLLCVLLHARFMISWTIPTLYFHQLIMRLDQFHSLPKSSAIHQNQLLELPWPQVNGKVASMLKDKLTALLHASGLTVLIWSQKVITALQETWLETSPLSCLASITTWLTAMMNANGEKERSLLTIPTSRLTKISSQLTSAIQKKPLGNKTLTDASLKTLNKCANKLNASGPLVKNSLKRLKISVHQIKSPWMLKSSLNASRTEQIVKILMLARQEDRTANGILDTTSLDHNSIAFQLMAQLLELMTTAWPLRTRMFVITCKEPATGDQLTITKPPLANQDQFQLTWDALIHLSTTPSASMSADQRTTRTTLLTTLLCFSLRDSAIQSRLTVTPLLLTGQCALEIPRPLAHQLVPSTMDLVWFQRTLDSVLQLWWLMTLTLSLSALMPETSKAVSQNMVLLKPLLQDVCGEEEASWLTTLISN